MIERNLKKITKLNARSFFLLILFILGSTVIMRLFNLPQPNLSNIVSKTQLHIKNINSKLQVLDNGGDASSKLADYADSTYLELLGFVKDAKLFEDDWTAAKNYTKNKAHQLFNNIPPIITAFYKFGEQEKALIESKLKHFPNDLMLIYDFDLSSSEQLRIKKLCNWSCMLKPFKADNYPRHLVNVKMKAYKPVIIQEALNEYGALIWIEAQNSFRSSNIQPFLDRAKQNGLLTWPLAQPITQLTHPTMFKHFDSSINRFYFVHMLDTSQLIIYNYKQIHERLMLPWVKCALKEECLAPRGSKYLGCDFDSRPMFQYAGCHRYEMSAFSIIASLLFDFDLSKYSIDFEKEEQDAKRTNSSSKMNLNDLFFVSQLSLKKKSENGDSSSEQTT